MPRIAYGKTWWGQQWLNALSHIDYDNRLPRGRSYANKGAVLSLERASGTMQAKVQGSRRTPYGVSIKIPQFDQQQQQKVLDAVQGNPAILAQLLNKSLPPELLPLLEAHDIHLFPSRWDDLAMHCSCPDWAVPCKHLAAVVYRMAEEIDLNPFIVFSMHGLDLLERLPESDGISTMAEENIPEVSQWWDAKKLAAWNGSEINETLDFSKIPDLRELLPGALAVSPPFCSQDFRELYAKGIKSLADHAQPRNALTKEDFPLWPKLFYASGITVVYDKNSHPTTVKLTSAGKDEECSWSQFIESLEALPQKDLPRLIAPLNLLHDVRQFCQKLLLRGAITPQLFQQQGTFEIRWFPALQDAQVQRNMDILQAMTPPGLACQINGKRLFHADGISVTSLLCSSILGHLMSGSVPSINRSLEKDNQLLQLFFGQKPLSLKWDVAQAVARWIKVFYIHQRELAPVLQITEKHPHFQLSLLVQRQHESRMQAPLPWQKFLASAEVLPQERLQMSKDVSSLAVHFPQLNNYLASDGEPISLDLEEMTKVLFGALPLMRLLGIKVLLDASLRHIFKPAVSMKLSTPKGTSASFLDLASLLNFDWQIAIGAQVMSVAAFKKLLKNSTGLVKIKNQYVHITPEELEKLYKALQNPSIPSSATMLQVAFGESYEGQPVLLSDDLRRQLKRLTSAPKVLLPQGLQAQLRPYQERGFAWLYKNSQLGAGAILADDMGLGKTIQALSLLLKLKEEKGLDKGKAIVIAPTTLLSNWKREIERFTPLLKPFIYHGAKRNLQEFDGYDVLLTSYGTLRGDCQKLKKQNWQVVILDEAQQIKNPSAAQTKAAKALPAKMRIALSGTPVENRLEEYWSIFDFVNHGYLGSLQSFSKTFARPITQERDQRQLQQFHKITSPFFMRREKTDKSVISDLPDKVENNSYCSLTPDQAALYESVVEDSFKIIEKSDGIERKGLVLKMMMALKQIGNHPAQYLKQKICDPALSGKMEMLLELTDGIIASGEKALIFTQFRQMGELLHHALQAQTGAPPLFLHGGLSRAKRDVMVNQFQELPGHNLFILSLKAGGTGLNLTAASHVIHYDLWWNPAVEAQATDRAYRIGQKRNVLVHRLINQNTLEERIDQMLQEKKDLAKLTVTKGEKWLGDLSNTDLRELVQLNRE